jgi:hypothetical protein
LRCSDEKFCGGLGFGELEWEDIILLADLMSRTR